MNRRAKIVCTLGPATATAPRLAELIDAGMDVARLNFSHGTQAEHSASYDAVRQIATEHPTTLAELSRVSGVGENKLAKFGQQLLDALARPSA